MFDPFAAMLEISLDHLDLFSILHRNLESSFVGHPILDGSLWMFSHPTFGYPMISIHSHGCLSLEETSRVPHSEAQWRGKGGGEETTFTGANHLIWRFSALNSPMIYRYDSPWYPWTIGEKMGIWWEVMTCFFLFNVLKLKNTNFGVWGGRHICQSHKS